MEKELKKTEFEEDSDFTVEILETIYSTDLKVITKTDKILEIRVSDQYMRFEYQGKDPVSDVYVIKVLTVKDGSDPIEFTRGGELANTAFAILTGVPFQ